MKWPLVLLRRLVALDASALLKQLLLPCTHVEIKDHTGRNGRIVAVRVGELSCSDVEFGSERHPIRTDGCGGVGATKKPRRGLRLGPPPPVAWRRNADPWKKMRRGPAHPALEKSELTPRVRPDGLLGLCVVK